MDTKSLIAGIVLVALGVVFLGNNLGWLDINLGYWWGTLWSEIWQLWPWVLVIIGGVFWYSWVKDRQNYGSLLPGTILITYGLLFYYCGIYGWWQMGAYNLWAFYIIGPGLGFLAMYFLGQRESGYLVPGLLLVLLGGFFLSGPWSLRMLWPLLLIAIGIRLLFKGRQEKGTTS